MSNGNPRKRKDGRQQPQGNIKNMFSKMTTTPCTTAPNRSNIRVSAILDLDTISLRSIPLTTASSTSISNISASAKRDRAMLDTMPLRSTTAPSRSISDCSASANRTIFDIDINNIYDRDSKLREMLIIEKLHQTGQWNPGPERAIANGVTYRQQQHPQYSNAIERSEPERPSRYVNVENRTLNGDTLDSVGGIGRSVETVAHDELASGRSDETNLQISTENVVALASSANIRSTSDSSKLSESNTEDSQNFTTISEIDSMTSHGSKFILLHYN